RDSAFRNAWDRRRSCSGDSAMHTPAYRARLPGLERATASPGRRAWSGARDTSSRTAVGRTSACKPCIEDHKRRPSSAPARVQYSASVTRHRISRPSKSPGRWHSNLMYSRRPTINHGILEIDLKNGSTFRLCPGDAVTIPARTVHRTRAIGHTVNLTFEHLAADTVVVDPPAM